MFPTFKDIVSTGNALERVLVIEIELDEALKVKLNLVCSGGRILHFFIFAFCLIALEDIVLLFLLLYYNKSFNHDFKMLNQQSQ